MLGSSLLGGLSFLLIISYVLAKKNKTDASTHDEKKNVTQEKRQNIGKYIFLFFRAVSVDDCITDLIT